MNFRVWMKAGVAFLACALVLGFASPQARAEESVNHLYDRFQVSASGSLLWLGSDIRIDGKNGELGTDVDAEEDLGMPDTKLQPRLSFRWKPGRKHQLELGYQFARREASKSLERTIAIGDTSFDAGAQINTSFGTDNAFLTYRYAFVADERKQIGAGLGLGAFFFDVGVDALASASSGSVSDTSGASFVGPTAALGVFGRFRTGDRWYLEPDIRYLRVTVDRFTGTVVEGSLLTQYYLSPKVGIEGGVGIKGVEVDVDPRTDGGFGPKIGARIKYTESQVRLGVVVPL